MADTERPVDPADYPDPELVARAALLDLADVATATPPDPEGTYSWLPLIRVMCTGGNDDGVTDRSSIAVDTFAATKGEAAALASSVRQRLTNTPIGTDFGTIDRATCSMRPNEVPYGDTAKVVRYAATYRISTRR